MPGPEYRFIYYAANLFYKIRYATVLYNHCYNSDFLLDEKWQNRSEWHRTISNYMLTTLEECALPVEPLFSCLLCCRSDKSYNINGLKIDYSNSIIPLFFASIVCAGAKSWGMFNDSMQKLSFENYISSMYAEPWLFFQCMGWKDAQTAGDLF